MGRSGYGELRHWLCGTEAQFSFIIVRSIVDIADVSLPNNLSKIVDKRGATRGAAALWELLKTPREFPKYRGLAKAKNWQISHCAAWRLSWPRSVLVVDKSAAAL